MPETNLILYKMLAEELVVKIDELIDGLGKPKKTELVNEST